MFQIRIKGVRTVSATNFLILGPISLLFFMMLFVPTTYREIKGALLVLVLVAISAYILQRRSINVHPQLLLWTFFYASLGLFFMLVGLGNGAPGALSVGTVYVLWPLLYLLIISVISEEQWIKLAFKIMVFATFSVSLYSLSFIFYSAGYLPDTLYLKLDQGQEIGFYAGFIEFNLYSITSMLFLVPFVFTLLMLSTSKGEEIVKRKWLIFTLIIGLLVSLLTARKALWLVLMIAPLIYIGISRLSASSFRRKIITKKTILVFVLAAVGLVWSVIQFGSELNLDAQKIYEEFESGFAFDENASAYPRKEQFLALLSEWSDSPILGFGHGSSAKGSLRSGDQPWAYELSYVALLFHVGILGFLGYLCGILWICITGLKILTTGHRYGLYILPLLVGMNCFLIANATNPYLEKFDYLWVIFLPVAVINMWLLKK